MPDVRAYIDYRQYLRDWLQEAKKKNASYSFQLLADKAGFRSRSFLKLVIDGKKNISTESVNKLNRVLKLEGASRSYFKDLVQFNQAASNELRAYFFKRLCACRQHNAARMIERNRDEFYSHWYHNTVRELVTFMDFEGDYARLGAMLDPEISAQEARRSVDLLLSLGFIRKEGNRYIQTEPLITTGDQVSSQAVGYFHHQNSLLIRKSLERFDGSERDITSLVMSLSPECFRSVRREISIFRKKLIELVSSDTNQNRVYHVNFQMFPTTKKQDDNSG
jgi:uncharacterized protein (TIGR02147 family)